MRCIYKYPLDGEMKPLRVRLPMDAIIVKFDFQEGEPMIWATVDPSKPKKPVGLQIIGTGEPIPEGARYLQTAFLGHYVWHLFMLARVPDPDPEAGA